MVAAALFIIFFVLVILNVPIALSLAASATFV